MLEIVNLSNNEIVNKFIERNNDFLSLEKGLKVIISSKNDIKKLEKNVLYITDKPLKNVCYTLVNSLNDSVTVLNILRDIAYLPQLIGIELNHIKVLVDKNKQMYFNKVDNNELTATQGLINFDAKHCTDCILNIWANDELTVNKIKEITDSLEDKLHKDFNLVYGQGLDRSINHITLLVILT